MTAVQARPDIRAVRYMSSEERNAVLDAVNAQLEGATAQEIAQWAVDNFGTDLVVASSMQDTVVAHLFSQVQPNVQVVFLDTGYHFPETLATRDEAARRLPITVLNVTARQTVAEQDADYGPRLHDNDPNLCCFLRKVEPLARALDGKHAWATGVRRGEAATRAKTRIVSWDVKHDIVKVAPIVAWSDEDVERYQRQYDLPRNPLLTQGYPSVGCAPCTRRVAPGEDPRSGRWSGQEKVECGIHI